MHPLSRMARLLKVWPKRKDFFHVLYFFSLRCHPVKVLQIGVNDGTGVDPLQFFIQHHGWRGLLVEPQPEPAARLAQRYENIEGIQVVQAAVDKENGMRAMYRLAHTRQLKP